MRRLFVDTSAWFAFANRDDPEHEAVAALLLDVPDARLVTSNLVFNETVTLCAHRLGHAVMQRVGGVLLDGGRVDLVRITPEDENAAWELLCKRTDEAYSFTDCASFVVMRRLSIEAAVALDSSFAAEGFESLPR